ncbi:hypothetical protein C1H46_004589 [Malus baccata]|uniref:Uncharacterized protein n=1 Tax=Malus baccata TaxID=106549 RepID=A0A540NFJ1_MALBA|nr:hypothetical protein C1H46_004589 [Malus baccata]
MVKMEDAKPEVLASNNSNSKSCDSGLLQDRFTDLCKMVFVIGRELLQASCKSVQRNQDLLISNASAIGNGTTSDNPIRPLRWQSSTRVM